MDLTAYAEAAGKNEKTLHTKLRAWRVLANLHVEISQIRDSWRNLAEIHAAPRWLWSALVAQMIEASWTVAPPANRAANLKFSQVPRLRKSAETPCILRSRQARLFALYPFLATRPARNPAEIPASPGPRIPSFSNIARRQFSRYVTGIGPVSGQRYLVDSRSSHPIATDLMIGKKDHRPDGAMGRTEPGIFYSVPIPSQAHILATSVRSVNRKHLF